MVGGNIKKYRRERGMSQEELAKELNVVRQTISKWENGLSVPDAQSITKLAEVFGISVNQLLTIPSDATESIDTSSHGEQRSISVMNEMMRQINRFQSVYINRDRKNKKALSFIIFLLLILGGVLLIRGLVILFLVWTSII